MTPSLPPHHGRKAALEILCAPCATHRIEVFDPAVAPNLPGGLGYRLFRAVPRAGDGGVLWLLDGNGAFDFLTPGMLERVPGVAVIGVGYQTDEQFARSERVYDYTPGGDRPDPHHPGRRAGGVAGFLPLLTGPLRAAGEAGLSVDPARRTLWGHSFGGLCALAAMPGGFARHALASPSVWWDEPAALALARCARGTVLLSLGDREQRTGSTGPAPQGPPPAALRLAEVLRAQPGVDLRLSVHPGAGHIATLPASLPDALSLAAAR
ncbi:alpha/beta hydrolase [Paenirhodobacter sp.]|uniref:alpha/beta hydrolase n=1 Tax=Paenirhodobacter sp. TaxID=1965326 RepID=UPI003B3D361D